MEYVLKTCLVLFFSSALIASSTLTVAARERIDPLIPSVASFIIPGFGQLINEQPEKAITHFVVMLGIDVGGLYLNRLTSGRYPIAQLWPAMRLAWSGYSAYDAYQVANRRSGTIFSFNSTEGDLEPEVSFNTDLSSKFGIEGSSEKLSVSYLSYQNPYLSFEKR